MPPTPPAGDPKTEIPKLLRRVETLIGRGEWNSATNEARAIARMARRAADPALMNRVGRLLRGLSLWRESAALMSSASQMMNPSPFPEWDGSPLDGKTIAIVEREDHIGRPLRFGRLLARAAEKSARCIAIVDPRLVDLFKRSFPGVDIRSRGADDENILRKADFVAGYETMVAHLAGSDEELASTFAPLIPDSSRTRRIGQQYRSSNDQADLPLFGISWHSTNPKKILPTLPQWSRFIEGSKGNFVSLQYGNIESDVREMERLSGRNIVLDAEIDSLVDLEGFAAQVAAMDVVVTISNTCAHMAGALGVRTFVLLDDINPLAWPLRGAQVAWYPSITLVRQQGRDWAMVLDEVLQKIA
jgi:hypothetical protein